jgi:hypothetical protein
MTMRDKAVWLWMGLMGLSRVSLSSFRLLWLAGRSRCQVVADCPAATAEGYSRKIGLNSIEFRVSA